MRGRLFALFVVSLSLTSGLWTQPSVARVEQGSKKARRPNVLMIISDDQGLGTMGAMPKTSAWFASGATHFPDAYVTTPLCCPSRSSIMTGRYAHNLNLDSRSLISRILQDAGYRTGVFGKYLNSWEVELNPPFFNDWAIIPKAQDGYRNGIWNVNGELATVRRYGTRFVGDRTARFIEAGERDDARPWFAYMSPPAPHSPFLPEPRYRDAPVPPWSGDLSNHESDPFVDTWMRFDKPAYVRSVDNDLSVGQDIREDQFRTLMSLDDVVAELRNTLAANDELADTLVIYFSDNGFLWSQHGLTGKFVPYQEALRVPAYFKWPSSIPRYATDERLMANIDIAPTILDVAGVAEDPRFPMDGRSLLDFGWDRSRLLIEAWSSGAIPTWAGFVSPDRAYIEYYGSDDRTKAFTEYYDLTDDPFQLNNLLGDPELLNDPDINALSADLTQARGCSGPHECP
jgi:arylsulfatase A-like enzyme